MFPSSLENKNSKYYKINSLNKDKEYKEYLRLFYVAMTKLGIDFIFAVIVKQEI